MFRGREMAHRDLGWKMMQRLVEDVAEVGLLETRPKQEGPNLSAVIAPKKPTGKGGQPQRPASPPPTPAPPKPAAGPVAAPSAALPAEPAKS